MTFPFNRAEPLQTSGEEALGGQRYTIKLQGENFSLLHWDGRGETVLILHANGFSAGTYAPLAQKLQKRGYNVVALDQRGHGRTQASWPPEHHYDWHLLGRDIAALLEEAVTPVHVMGHSLGGLAAIYATAFHPASLASLTLLDHTMFGPQYHLYFNMLKWSGLWLKIPIIKRTIYRSNYWPDSAGAFHHFRPKNVFATWSDDFLMAYILSGTRAASGGGLELACNPTDEAGLFTTTPHYIYKELRRLPCPPATLLLYGEYSYIIGKMAVRGFKRSWPRAQVKCVPGGTHFFPMSHSDYLCEIWQEWQKHLQTFTPMC